MARYPEVKDVIRCDQVETGVTVAEAKEKVERALAELFEKDGMPLTLDVTEECIVHKFAQYLAP